MKSGIYLDNNASTVLDPSVKDLLVDTLHVLQGNPSSMHSAGQRARIALSRARSQIANFLKTKPSEIIFTSGGTECANMIIRGISSNRRKGHIITSSVEHSCVYGTAQELQQQGFNVAFLSPGVHGAISPEAVQAAIQSDTILIALTAANNETGVKTDIAAIGRIAQQAHIPFFVDGVALLGKELFEIAPGVSAIGFSGHKVHALQGTGFAYIHPNLKLTPILSGGEQEFGRRAGTENLLGAIALGKAIEILASVLPQATFHMQAMRDKLESLLISNLDGVSINGAGPRVANTSNLAFEGVDGESLLIALDNAGIAASHGSACASGSLEPSRVLLNMGLPHQRVSASIRFSLSRFTTQEEIDRAAEGIIKCIKRLKDESGRMKKRTD